MTTTLPPGPCSTLTPTPGRFGINPRLGAVALGVPVVFREDSIS